MFSVKCDWFFKFYTVDLAKFLELLSKFCFRGLIAYILVFQKDKDFFRKIHFYFCFFQNNSDVRPKISSWFYSFQKHFLLSLYQVCLISRKNFNYTWDKVFKNGSSKIWGREPLKNFTWPILETRVETRLKFCDKNIDIVKWFEGKRFYFVFL